VIVVTKLRRVATKVWEKEFVPILENWGFAVSKAHERKSRSTIYRVHYKDKGELVGELYLKDYRTNDAWVTLYLSPPEALWAVVSQSINRERWIREAFRKCLTYLVAGAARGKIRCYNCPESIFYSDGKTLIVLTFMVLQSCWVWQITYRFGEVEDATAIKKPLSENPLITFEELKKVAVFVTTV
jgi:hypothetical protein